MSDMTVQPDMDALNQQRITERIWEWARAGRAVEWRPVPGFEGSYVVSSDGRVRSVERTITRSNGSPQTIPERELSMHLLRTGYLSVSLAKDGVQKTFTVHGLVARAFHGDPPPPADQVRHLDGDRTNNAAANLKWGTSSENQYDTVAHGTHSHAKKTHCPQDHDYTPENTYVDRRGKRYCRACLRAREKFRPKRKRRPRGGGVE